MNLSGPGPSPSTPTRWTPSSRLAAPALLGFLMEAAGHNADALGVSILQLAARNLTWMLSRLRVRLREHPGWRASLTVETWPSRPRQAVRPAGLPPAPRRAGDRRGGQRLAADRHWSGAGRCAPRARGTGPRMIHPERALEVDLDEAAAVPRSPRGRGARNGVVRALLRPGREPARHQPALRGVAAGEPARRSCWRPRCPASWTWISRTKWGPAIASSPAPHPWAAAPSPTPWCAWPTGWRWPARAPSGGRPPARAGPALP